MLSYMYYGLLEYVDKKYAIILTENIIIKMEINMEINCEKRKYST